MNNNWEDNILDIIKDISDKEYQKEAWFGLNPDIIDSPEEMYSTLFDDYEFEDFIDTYNNLSNKQKNIALELISLMNNIDNFNYKYLLDSKEWGKVRNTAKLFLETFKNEGMQ